MRRRGYTPASIRKFCEMIGVTRADGGLVDIAMLTHAIRSDLEDNAPRAMCVLKPLKVVLTNVPEDHEEVYEVAGHPARDDMPTRRIPFTREVYIDRDDFMEEPPKKFFRLAPGKEVRLRNSYVIRCDEVIKDDEGEVTELRCSVDFDTLGKNPEDRKVKGVLHWVSAIHGIPMEVRLYDNLFQVEQPDKDRDADFLEHLNPESLVTVQGIGEPSLAGTEPESRYQFERVGYFCADRYASRPDTWYSTVPWGSRTPGRRSRRRADMQIYNTLTRRKETFTPIEPGRVRMYVCGMTVYDYCHLGHARVMVAFDVITRYLRARGYDVTYVRNITDIDDKILKRAEENGEAIESLTDRMIDAMHEDEAGSACCGPMPSLVPPGTSTRSSP